MIVRLTTAMAMPARPQYSITFSWTRMQLKVTVNTQLGFTCNNSNNKKRRYQYFSFRCPSAAAIARSWLDSLSLSRAPAIFAISIFFAILQSTLQLSSKHCILDLKCY